MNNNKVMAVSGLIYKILDEKIIGETKFKKREVVIFTRGEYPQKILIEFNQEKCERLKSFKEGDEVVVNIKLKGREWINPEGRAVYYNSIKGWEINLKK